MAVPKKRKSRAWKRHSIKINILKNNILIRNKFYFDDMKLINVYKFVN